jgi:hypothetical protein
MKRGKRSKGEQLETPASDASDAAVASETWTPADDRAATPEPPSESWTAADERAAAPDPATQTWTPADERAAAADPGPVVDSEAVELTGSAPAPEPAARPVPVTIHEPAHHDAPAPASNPIVDVSGAPGATAPSYDGHAAEPPADPLQPVRALVAERPELAVGAAFAGGIVAAMILRRLGN